MAFPERLRFAKWLASRRQEVLPEDVNRRSVARRQGFQPPAEVGGWYWGRTSDLLGVNQTL